jgi:membrane-bound serine protease (ClpP class)
MTALGFVLLLIGAILVVAEAHVPGLVLGVAGGMALIAGGIVLIASLGGAAAVAVPVGVALGAGAGGWTILSTRRAAGSHRVRVQSGAEALCGRIGVVRGWGESDGHVFVDGALWRARHQPADAEPAELREGDSVVVERVSGLTLSVRRAEEWELIL